MNSPVRSPSPHDRLSLGDLADDVARARDYVVVLRTALLAPVEIDNETVLSLFTVADDAAKKLGDVMAQLSPEAYGALAEGPR